MKFQRPEKLGQVGEWGGNGFLLGEFFSRVFSVFMVVAPARNGSWGEQPWWSHGLARGIVPKREIPSPSTVPPQPGGSN